MSWAANDPEGWSLVCRRAIASKYGIGLDDEGSLDYFLEEVEIADPSIFDALLERAPVGDEEADYLLSKAGM